MFPSSSPSSSEISELCHNKTFFMKYLHSFGTLSKQDAKDGVDGSSSQWSADDCLIGYRPFRRSPSLFSDSNRDGRSVMFSENNPDLRAACFSRGLDMADRGTKRKMMEPVPSCNMVKKKRMFTGASRISGFIGPNNSKETCDDEDKECMHEKKTRAREKRRRRREKNHEKYGDKHRWAFTCAFCKFHTFEDKDIEKHFGSSNHRETLDHIRRQAKFDDKVISFLHDCMVHKFRKTVSALHKLKTSCVRSKDRCAPIMEGVMEEDYMRRVEVVHCVACDIYIPVVYSSVQQHLHSLNHLRRKVIYKDQLQKESVVTAKAIINNDNVKVCYEKYIKGEDPFAVDTKYRSFDCQEPEEEDVEKYSTNRDIN